MLFGQFVACAGIDKQSAVGYITIGLNMDDPNAV
jgi:hypothetical protein